MAAGGLVAYSYRSPQLARKVVGQGCQFFSGTAYQNGINIPNIPKPVKYTNIFHCKTLQNLPKLEFLV
jgi:hypothetical protein